MKKTAILAGVLAAVTFGANAATATSVMPPEMVETREKIAATAESLLAEIKTDGVWDQAEAQSWMDFCVDAVGKTTSTPPEDTEASLGCFANLYSHYLVEGNGIGRAWKTANLTMPDGTPYGSYEKLDGLEEQVAESIEDSLPPTVNFPAIVEAEFAAPLAALANQGPDEVEKCSRYKDRILETYEKQDRARLGYVVNRVEYCWGRLD